MADAVAIGSLRWPVAILQRVQVADGAGGSSLTETLTNAIQVRADIQPIGPMTFLAGQQTDRPITHRIRLRWLDWLDETYVIVRQTLRLDMTGRTEIYRIRRVKEIAGRKRFLEVEAELETRA